jgi:integrase
MLPADVRLLSPAKLASAAAFLGLEARGKRGILVMRKSLTDPRTHEARQIKRSTGTTDLRLAVLRASQWWDEFSVEVHAGRLPTLGTTRTGASLNDIRAHYLVAATCAPHVRKKNFQRLALIVAEMFPDVADPLSLGVEVLDGRMVRLWQLRQKTQAEETFLPKDPAGCERAKRGTNDKYRAARSVFSRKMIRSYEDAGLIIPPGVAEFARQSFMPASKAPPSQQLRPEVVAKIVRLMPRLRIVRPGIWACLLLMFRGGLRNSEAAKARWDWLAESVDGSWRLALHTQDDYKPKAEARQVALSAGVVAMLQSVRLETNGKKDLHLVPAVSDAERAHFCGRALNKFLRACGVQAVKNKVAYRLRGHAITEVILAHGMKAAQGFAGHASDRTTEIYRGAEVPYTPLAAP